MLNLTICTVAFNEERNIVRMLDSVKDWASQIVVLDCESSDATARIAGEYGAVVRTVKNIIPEINKNESMKLAQCDWVMILDPDEVLTPEIKSEIASVISQSTNHVAYKMPRLNYYFGTPLRHGGNYPDRQIRLLRRGAGAYPGKGYHESLQLNGTVGELQNYFEHHPYPTFEVWMQKFDFYTRYGAGVFKANNTPINSSTIRRQMILRPMRRWLSRLFVKQGIRDGVPGVLSATFDFMTQVVSFGRYWLSSVNSDQ